MATHKTTIDFLREEIDEIDNRLLALIQKRMAVVRKVGEYKKQQNLPVVDEDRRNKVMYKFEKRAMELGMDAGFGTALYNVLHKYAVKVEKDLQ